MRGVGDVVGCYGWMMAIAISNGPPNSSHCKKTIKEKSKHT